MYKGEACLLLNILLWNETFQNCQYFVFSRCTSSLGDPAVSNLYANYAIVVSQFISGEEGNTSIDVFLMLSCITTNRLVHNGGCI